MRQCWQSGLVQVHRRSSADELSSLAGPRGDPHASICLLRHYNIRGKGALGVWLQVTRQWQLEATFPTSTRIF